MKPTVAIKWVWLHESETSGSSLIGDSQFWSAHISTRDWSARSTHTRKLDGSRSNVTNEHNNIKRKNSDSLTQTVPVITKLTSCCKFWAHSLEMPLFGWAYSLSAMTLFGWAYSLDLTLFGWFWWYLWHKMAFKVFQEFSPDRLLAAGITWHVWIRNYSADTQSIVKTSRRRFSQPYAAWLHPGQSLPCCNWLTSGRTEFQSPCWARVTPGTLLSSTLTAKTDTRLSASAATHTHTETTHSQLTHTHSGTRTKH